MHKSTYVCDELRPSLDKLTNFLQLILGIFQTGSFLLSALYTLKNEVCVAHQILSTPVVC